MNQTNVALLAAGLPALIASATFMAGQILGAVSKTRRRRVAAVVRIIDALDRIPRKAVSPPLTQVFSHPELEVAAFTNRLIISLPKRDQILWDWLQLRTMELVRGSYEEKILVGSSMQGVLTSWLTSRRKTRKYIRGELSKK